jgi:hypothetical protein
MPGLGENIGWEGPEAIGCRFAILAGNKYSD